MVRVAQIIGNVQTGGAEHHLLDLVEGLRDRSIHSTVLAPRPGPLTATLEQRGFPVTCVDMVQPRPSDDYGVDPDAYEQITTWLRAQSPDVVHSHLYPAHLHASLAAHEIGVHAAVYTAHTLVIRPGDVILARATSTHTVATSHCVARALIDAGVPEQAVTVVYNGVGPEHFVRDATCRASVRAALQLGSGLVVGTVARLSPEKRIDLLLKAAASFCVQQPTIRVVIVGDGPARGELERLVDELGIRDQVRFLGSRADITVLNRLWDVFVLPSPDEACPLALLEAMAAGRAVVAADAGGSADLVTHGVDGLLASASDVCALAQAITGLLEDAPTRGVLGAAARARVGACFTRDRMVDQTLTLYRRLLA